MRGKGGRGRAHDTFPHQRRSQWRNCVRADAAKRRGWPLFAHRRGQKDNCRFRFTSLPLFTRAAVIHRRGGTRRAPNFYPALDNRTERKALGICNHIRIRK